MSKGDNREVDEFKPLKPEPLLAGVTIEEIKSLGAVKAYLNTLAEEERVKAYESGYREGMEAGEKRAYDDSKAEFEVKFDEELAKHTCQIGEIIDLLKSPVSELETVVLDSYRKDFKDLLMRFAKNTTYYDDSISESLKRLLNNSPVNNRVVRLVLNAEFSDQFLKYFADFNVDVERKEMKELLRVETSNGNYRLDIEQMVEDILSKGKCI